LDPDLSHKSTRRTTKIRYWNCVYRQMLIDAKLKSGKRGKKTELTGRSTLRRGRYELDCSAT
jgi:hypothetical protein